MRAGEALGLDIRSIHPDFRTLDIVQKAKRGKLQDYMKTKNADSRHGRVVDLPAKLAAVLQDFVGTRRSGLVFCEKDGSQISQRDILKSTGEQCIQRAVRFCGFPQNRFHAVSVHGRLVLVFNEWNVNEFVVPRSGKQHLAFPVARREGLCSVLILRQVET
jgi:hypothetical protein